MEYATSYERALFGNFANDDTRSPAPNVIELGIEAIGGRDNYRHSWRGHEIWHMGRWNGPYKLEEFMRQANMRLRADGKPQITVNPSWAIEEREACDVVA
jgi:hypothetical protein